MVPKPGHSDGRQRTASCQHRKHLSVREQTPRLSLRTGRGLIPAQTAALQFLSPTTALAGAPKNGTASGWATSMAVLGNPATLPSGGWGGGRRRTRDTGRRGGRTQPAGMSQPASPTRPLAAGGRCRSRCPAGGTEAEGSDPQVPPRPTPLEDSPCEGHAETLPRPTRGFLNECVRPPPRTKNEHSRSTHLSISHRTTCVRGQLHGDPNAPPTPTN